MLFDLLVLSGVFGSLCFFIPTRMDGDELFTFYWCALIVICSLFFKKRRELSFKLLGINVLMAWLTMFLNFTIPVRWQFINLLLGVLAVVTISQTTQITTRKLGFLLLAYCLVSDLFIVLQIFKLDKIFMVMSGEISGISINPWIMGCAAVIALPFVYRIHPLWCLAVVPNLYYSLSMSCVVSAAIVFCYLAVRSLKIDFKKVVLTVLILLIVYAVFFAHHLNMDRFDMWIVSMKYMKNSVHGNGFGSWAHEAFIRTNGADVYHWRWAHNEFFQHYFEQGKLGLTFLLLWFGILLLWTRDLFVKASLMGISLVSCFHPTMHVGKLLGLAIVVISLAYVSIQNQLTEK